MSTPHRQAWEDWARVDPLWAIVTQEGRDHGRWNVEEFFASGQVAIDALWSTASAFGVPQRTHRGLDFGCGVGRLTVALRRHLDVVVGLDIAEAMVEQAKGLASPRTGLSFFTLDERPLETFAKGSFDVVCSLLVLQHLGSASEIEWHLEALLQLVAPGGLLILQLPARITDIGRQSGVRALLRPRTRLAVALRRLGFKPSLLYRYLAWRPEMTMMGVDEERVRELVTGGGGTILWRDRLGGQRGIDDRIYLIAR